MLKRFLIRFRLWRLSKLTTADQGGLSFIKGLKAQLDLMDDTLLVSYTPAIGYGYSLKTSFVCVADLIGALHTTHLILSDREDVPDKIATIGRYTEHVVFDEFLVDKRNHSIPVIEVVRVLRIHTENLLNTLGKIKVASDTDYSYYDRRLMGMRQELQALVQTLMAIMLRS